MDIPTLLKGIELLDERDNLIAQRGYYTNNTIRLSIQSKCIALSVEDQNAIRKILVDRLQAQIDKINMQIAEL